MYVIIDGPYFAKRHLAQRIAAAASSGRYAKDFTF
jgi:hypothetical protein